jgi:PIN domain nuclease of toxin-antitoxin system
MRLLIDTQIFIWAVMGSENLSVQAREIILNATDVLSRPLNLGDRHQG